MAVTLLGAFLCVWTLALNEALHRALHADAGTPQHQCAVTLFQSGQVETPVVVVTPVVAVAEIIPARPGETIFLPSVDCSLPPSCGPPALVS